MGILNALKPEYVEPFYISNEIHTLVGAAVMFLVVFRTQYAFNKWWSGRSAFGDIVLYSRMVASQSCAYILDDELCRKIVKYVITTVVAARCHLRNERCDPDMLAGILGDAEIEAVNTATNMPYFATWVVRSSFATAVHEGKCMPFHMALDNAVRALENSISMAERLLTPMPFIYVAHLRSFLFSYLLFLPFVLVELGGLMVLAVALASYLLFGLESLAVTLENPFGYEDNDLPLDLYCIEVTRDLLCLLELRAKAKQDKQDEEDAKSVADSEEKSHQGGATHAWQPGAFLNMDDGGDDD